MKAAVLHEVGKPLAVEEIDLDEPRAGEVRIEMAAAGVCHSDHHVMVGDIPALTPMVLGHEGAGVIDAVGSGVTSVKPGDHVVTVWRYSCGTCEPCLTGRPATCIEGARMRRDGSLYDGTTRFHKAGERIHHFMGISTFSEYAVMSERSVLKIREDVPLAKAALVSCAVATGVGAVVNAAKARPGESVAVFGAGGVGLNAVQGAALVGAEPIIAVDLMQGKLEMAKKFGATHLVNSSDEDPVARIREITGGWGAHYAIEAIGVAEVAAQAFRSLRIGGMAVMVGLDNPKATIPVPAVSLVLEEKRLVGSLYGTSPPRREVPRLLELYMTGKLNLDDLLSRAYPLAQINEAYDALLRGEVARSVIDFSQ